MSFKFEDNSKKVKQDIKDTSRVGMQSALLMVEASAKSRAPVDSGELKDKIDNEIQGSGNEIIGQVGSPLKYAPYVEFGTGEFAENGMGRKGGWSFKDEEGKWVHTKGQEPQPFLRPAFRANKNNIVRILGEAFGVRFSGE